MFDFGAQFRFEAPVLAELTAFGKALAADTIANGRAYGVEPDGFVDAKDFFEFWELGAGYERVEPILVRHGLDVRGLKTPALTVASIVAFEHLPLKD